MTVYTVYTVNRPYALHNNIHIDVNTHGKQFLPLVEFGNSFLLRVTNTNALLGLFIVILPFLTKALISRRAVKLVSPFISCS